jgi:hypothetical protein
MFTQNGPCLFVSDCGLANPTSTGCIVLLFNMKHITVLYRVEDCNMLDLLFCSVANLDHFQSPSNDCQLVVCLVLSSRTDSSTAKFQLFLFSHNQTSLTPSPPKIALRLLSSLCLERDGGGGGGNIHKILVMKRSLTILPLDLNFVKMHMFYPSLTYIHFYSS